MAIAMVAILAGASAPQAQTLLSIQESGSSKPDFTLFPFWQKLLSDMKTATFPDLLAPHSVTANFIPVAIATPSPTSGASAADCADLRHCVPPEWILFLATLQGRPAREQIDAVNRWANARPYVEDMTNWFLPDYWATPGEFIARGGDCEDFAITKYLSLVRLGFAPKNLRISIVADTRNNSFHAVLTVSQDGETLVLDNFLADVALQMTLPWYRTIYALNEEGWQIHNIPAIHLAGTTITASRSAHGVD